jgi:hypothetical protein
MVRFVTLPSARLLCIWCFQLDVERDRSTLGSLTEERVLNFMYVFAGSLVDVFTDALQRDKKQIIY